MSHVKSSPPLALVLLCALACVPPVCAQSPDPKLEDLAARLVSLAGNKLPNGGRPGEWTCFVLDFREDNAKRSRLGVHLAREFSHALQENVPGIAMLDRDVSARGASSSASGGLQQILEAETSSSQKSGGGDFTVSGEITKLHDSLSLKVHLRGARGELLAETSGRLARTPELRALEGLPPEGIAAGENQPTVISLGPAGAPSANPLASKTVSDAPKPDANPPDSVTCVNCSQPSSSLADSGTARRLRVGTDTSAPVCVYCPSPTYSAAANRSKIEGVVLLEVSIAEDGSVQDVKVRKGLPDGLTEQAVATVRNWRFKPIIGPNGQPVAVQIAIEVSFKLLRKQ